MKRWTNLTNDRVNNVTLEGRVSEHYTGHPIATLMGFRCRRQSIGSNRFISGWLARRETEDMSHMTQQLEKADVNVGMAQIEQISDGVRARAILGSCIGLSLYQPTRRIAIVAHIVLPAAEGRPGSAGKFADTAIPLMIDMFKRHGIHRSGLIAKLAGGANMFGGNGPIQIGADNIETVKSILASMKIPIQGEHVGGQKGRRIVVDSATGEMVVEIAGASPVTF